MKRFIALVLSLVMALSLCAPAWAAGDTMLGTGTEDDPYIIKTAADLTAISDKYDTYAYYKVADGVETLDLTGVGKIYLNGSFDGNGVTLNNLTTALFQTVGKVGVAQEIKISNFTANVHTTDGSALVRNIYNPGETTFEKVTMHGYIEGQYNMGSFYNYGTANAGGSDGADYTVNFVNATSDVTLVCTSGNIIGGMLGHGYEGANYKLYINMDANSKYTGTMYTTNGGENCYQVMGMCSHATYILNGEETSRYDNKYSSTKLTIAAPTGGADGYYVATATDVDHYVVSVNAQMTAYGDDGKKIANLAGMTWPLGNVTITDTDGKVFDLIESAEIVNGVEHDFGYAMNDGVLTIYSGRSDNYLSGWVTLQVNQYDKNSKLLATGSLRVHTFEDPTFSTVSFDANDGSGEMNALEKANGVTFTLPECAFDAPAGKQFKGWSIAPDGDVITDTTYTVTKATTLYAIWEDITYSVVFKANGGNGEMASVDVPAGKYTPPADDEVKFTAPSGYKFKGWSTTPDGVVITSLNVTDDVNLYAIWSIEVPVSAEENKNTVQVDAVVNKTTATLDTVAEAELDKVIGEQVDTGTVTIDFSKLTGTEETETGAKSAPIDTVVIPTTVIEQIAEAATNHGNDTEGLKIVLGDGVSIEFDAVALASKADLLTGDDVTISVKPTDDADVTLKPAQDKTVGDRPAYDITVTSGGNNVFGIGEEGGIITLSAPYALKDGESAWGINVYYVDENGNKEWCKTSYDGKTVTWETSHLSVYMIEHEAYYGWSGYYPVVGGTSSSTADKTVTSAKTFDAGIGMYVAMSVMAAAGSAVIMGKKRED